MIAENWIGFQIPIAFSKDLEYNPIMKIERKDYLAWLKRWKDQQIIKVVSGVRRCGKSTLFELYRDWLLSQGVQESQIVSVNFEAVEFEHLQDYHKLHDYLVARLQLGKMTYIFLDEIQHVESYEKAVDSLFIRENCDVYITGSNAYFKSSELATLLSGRYVELKMLPLSFAEFYEAVEQRQQSHAISKSEVFKQYLDFGSFPYFVRYELPQQGQQDYLRDVYNSILLKDVVARLRVSDVTTLENVTKFLLSNIGNLVSASKIVNTLKSQGKGADQKTIDKYVHGLTDSLLLYEAPRYNLKGKAFLRTNPKYYVVDTGLRNMLVKAESSDIGHLLENVVYLELKRRGYEVFVGQLESGEVDFVCRKGEEICYFQVTYLLADESIIAREFGVYESIKDNYPKFVLSLDQYDMSRNGIRHINLIDWLLSS